MSITTLDGVLAGMRPPEYVLKTGVTMKAAGQPHSHFYSTGRPGAAAAPSPGAAGAALTSYAGQIPFTNPSSGNSYLARYNLVSGVVGTFLLCDRLWHNSGLSPTTTGAQTVNSATLPARDSDGASDGNNILAAIEWSAAGGAGTPNLTLSYTNAAGASGKTTATLVGVTTPNAGTFEIFRLAAGDKGIRSIQSYSADATRSSGTFHLVLFRVLSQINISQANVGQAVDALTSGFPRLYDNTVPFLVQIPTATTATTLQGSMIVTQG